MSGARILLFAVALGSGLGDAGASVVGKLSRKESFFSSPEPRRRQAYWHDKSTRRTVWKAEDSNTQQFPGWTNSLPEVAGREISWGVPALKLSLKKNYTQINETRRTFFRELIENATGRMCCNGSLEQRAEEMGRITSGAQDAMEILGEKFNTLKEYYGKRKRNV